MILVKLLEITTQWYGAFLSLCKGRSLFRVSLFLWAGAIQGLGGDHGELGATPKFRITSELCVTGCSSMGHRVAQLVERRTLWVEVRGSKPALGNEWWGRISPNQPYPKGAATTPLNEWWLQVYLNGINTVGKKSTLPPPPFSNSTIPLHYLFWKPLWLNLYTYLIHVWLLAFSTIIPPIWKSSFYDCILLFFFLSLSQNAQEIRRIMVRRILRIKPFEVWSPPLD